MNTEKPERINVRLPPQLRQSLEDRAEQNGNSLNTEIVSRLERSHSRYTVCFEDHWMTAMLRHYDQQAKDHDRSFAEEIIQALEPTPAPTPEEYKEQYGLLLEEMERRVSEMDDLPSLIEEAISKALARRENEDR